jgi:protein SCO1/2
LWAAAIVCLAAGLLTFVTAASSRLRPADVEVRTLSVVPEPSPAPAPAAEWMKEYTLTERSGATFHSRELQGQVHVVNFFFSSCPSVCRLQSGKVRELAQQFGPQGVRFLSITCDPQTDTPAALQQYARLFDADPEDWLFLTSDDLNYLRRVGAEVYQVPVEKQLHSERLIVVDQQGTLRGAFHWNQPPEMVELRKTLQLLLAEGKARQGA